MSLAVLADHLASKGRNGDTMLVHMTPEEVHGLHALALAHGGQLTINPETGLPEANFLKKMLPMIAGMALNFIAPGVGTAIGGMLGVSGAVGTGIAIGGLTGLATGSLKQGIMAGLGAYGGASLGAGLSAAGATPGAGLIDAANVSIPADAAARAAESGLSQEALRSQVSRQMAQEAFRNAGPLDKILASAKGLTGEAGRQAFMTGVGGASGLMRAGLTAAAGADAFGQPQTATPMPGGGFQYTPRIRPMSWNQYTGQLEQLPMFSAINKAGLTPAPAPAKTEEQPPGGFNTGGIVALADGGVPPPKATREEVLAAYRANPLAELNPNQEAINYWMGQGLGGFNQVVQDVRAANPMLAKQIDAARAVAQPAPLNLSTAGYNFSAEPVDVSKPAIISGTAPAGYSYADAAITNQQEQQINQLYRNILNRDVEQEGLNYWMGQAQKGLSMPEIEAQIRQISRDIGVKAPTPPVSTAADVTYGGNTVTPEYVAPTTTPTLGPAFQPTAPTMGQVVSDYEKGGGSTRMPTITDIKPTDRTYTQNEAVSLLRGYLQTNPNALYSDVQKFAASRGIPEMQARAAYNEFRFDTMTGGTKQAYDYLMGRAPYSVKPFVPGGGPIMRPYAEAVGLAAPGSTGGGSFFGRKTIPTSPTDKTAQSTTGGGSTTSSANTGGGTTTTGGGITLLNKSNTTTSNTGTGVDTTRSTDASTVGGVVVGNNVIDPISGRVLGVVTANVDQGTGGIIQGDVIVDPISGKIIGYTGDAGLTGKLFNKNIGEEPAIIESREIGGGDAGYDYDVGAGYYDDAANRDRSFYYDYAAPSRSFDDMGFGSVYYGNTAFTPQERAALLGLRGGGLADVAAMSAARGGNVQGYNLGGYSDGGRLLRGPGDGVSDSIPATIGNKQPARLADGEFVIPARIVSEIGNGSTEAGARKLYAMMDRVQRARAKTTGKGKVAKNTRAEKYLPA